MPGLYSQWLKDTTPKYIIIVKCCALDMAWNGAASFTFAYDDTIGHRLPKTAFEEILLNETSGNLI